MAAEELFFPAEHVHGAALAVGITVPAPSKLGHDAFGVHAGGQHVAMVTVGGDELVAVFHGHLHADDHGFLADIEMAKTADEAHAIELARLFLKAADEQHVLIGAELFLGGKAAIFEV